MYLATERDACGSTALSKQSSIPHAAYTPSIERSWSVEYLSFVPRRVTDSTGLLIRNHCDLKQVEQRGLKRLVGRQPPREMRTLVLRVA